MISFLSGTVLNKGRGYAIILVGDVGYKVFFNPAQYAELDVGQKIEAYIYHYIKEDASDLYGFNTMEKLEMFEMLLSISGIGPKSALGVLAIAEVGDIKEAIARGDSTLLTKVSGIGKKTAERVVLELREKIGALSFASGSGGSVGIGSGEEIDALLALGYSLPIAREALRKVDPGIKDSGERIKAALKGLGRRF